MDVREVLIKPEDAKVYIDYYNKTNRKIEKTRVKRFAKYMTDGEWKSNGETIKILKNGMIADGQHRLSAIVESGIAQTMLIAYDVSEETFKTVDIGKKRTDSQVLVKEGIKNATAVAGAARMLVRLKESNGKDALNGAVPTFKILDICKNNESLQESASFISSRKWLRDYFKPGVGTFVHYMFNNYDPIACLRFLTAVEQGVGLESGSPILVLREHLLTTRSGSRQTKKHNTISTMSLIFNSFKMYLDGAKTTRKKTIIEYDDDVFNLNSRRR